MPEARRGPRGKGASVGELTGAQLIGMIAGGLIGYVIAADVAVAAGFVIGGLLGG